MKIQPETQLSNSQPNNQEKKGFVEIWHVQGFGTIVNLSDAAKMPIFDQPDALNLHQVDNVAKRNPTPRKPLNIAKTFGL